MPILDKLYQANINPLYVNKFDTKDTFDDIVRVSEASDNLAATLKRDQVLAKDNPANAQIFSNSLNALDKASESGNIHYRDKYKAVKKLAAAYVNDPERNAHLKSVNEREELDKELSKPDNSAFKPYIQAVSDQSYGGAKKDEATNSWQTYSATALPAVKYVDQTKKANEVGAGFKEQGNEQDGYFYSDNQGRRIQASQSTEGVVPEEVKNFAQQTWRNDTEFNRSETLSAEIQAVQTIQNQAAQQGHNISLAQARQLAYDPNFKQEYVEKNVPKVNAKGEYVDANGQVTKTPIYEDVKFQANPLDFAKQQREHEFVKMTTDKFSGYKTKFKVDERDDAKWLYDYKKKAEQDNTEPITTPGQEQDTGFQLPTVEVDNDETASVDEIEGTIKMLQSRRDAFVKANITGKPYNQAKQDELAFYDADIMKKKVHLIDNPTSKTLDETTQKSLKYLGYDPKTIKTKGDAAKIINEWNNQQKNYPTDNLQLGVDATKDLTTMVKAGGLQGGNIYIPKLGKSIPFDELFSGNYDDFIQTEDAKGNNYDDNAKREAFLKSLNNAKISLTNTKADLRNGKNVRFTLDYNGNEIQVMPNVEFNNYFTGIAQLKRQEHDPSYQGVNPQPVLITKANNTAEVYRGIYKQGKFVVQQQMSDKSWKDTGKNITSLSKELIQDYKSDKYSNSGLGASKPERTLTEN